jgi:two-component system sensor histidine kinase CpxA
MMVLAVHKLFWKIFLSFWLTLIIFTGVLMFAASSYLEHIRTQQDIGSVRSPSKKVCKG